MRMTPQKIEDALPPSVEPQERLPYLALNYRTAQTVGEAASSWLFLEAHILNLIEAATLAERERCATLADNIALHCDDNDNHYGASAAEDVADAIRGKD